MDYKQLLLAFGLTLSSLGAAANGSAMETTQATLQQLPKQQVLDGVVEAVNQATISAQISGRVTKVMFDVDDFVEKDAVLVRIRDKEYKARLAKAKASLKEARAHHKDAQLEFDRVNDLRKTKVVSQANLDKAKAGLKAAEAKVSAAEAALAEAEEQLANTVIRAPYAGVVTQRHVEKGETVSPGKPVMTGLSLQKLRTTVNVPQTFINAIRQFKQAEVITDDQQHITGKKITIFPYADEKSHTFRVRVELPETQQALFPGMLVKVAFTVDQQARLLVPASAVFNRSEVNAVYVLDADNKLHMRQVRLGHRFNNQIEILAGLNAGETVALDPVRAGVQLKAQAE